ncbi:septation protein SpoVG family protein [Ruminococcus sp.]|uniref:septation protein SpoVG family protein n=1 Tax=Ruminococcus sp. TaxID=41978 RepID=UPI002E78D3D4|nr:septation protein SpoVG family protein [Ruminococcus sp.]MEE0838916.1 septation protein SpoVG family protein [Ruminococcus sp.]
MRIHASINRMVNKEDSAIKAYASVTMDGMFAVHGLRVIETEKGRFVNMPSTSYTPIRTATSSTATPSTP